MKRDPYRSAISEGIIRVLLEAGHKPGSPVAMVDASVVADELVTALAFVIHSSPECVTKTGRRVVSDRMARRLSARIGEVQVLVSAGDMPFVETRGTVQ